MDFYGPFPHLRTKRTTRYWLENDIFDGVEYHIKKEAEISREKSFSDIRKHLKKPSRWENEFTFKICICKSKTICAMPKGTGVFSVIYSVSIHKYKTMEKDEIKTVPFDSISDQKI